MGTVVTLHVVHPDSVSTRARDAAVVRDKGGAREAAVVRAKDWFRRVESSCNRFDPTSELRRLCETPKTPVPVSELLFEVTQFALAVAEASEGAFDPTVGARMELRGFDRDYRTGDDARSLIAVDATANYHDVVLDTKHQTITLQKPLLLDLGAVAKGLAIDLAARELHELQHFMIDAGGDLFVSGHNVDGEAWRVGIRHPRDADAMIRTLRVTKGAVCTSGDYERIGSDGAHHLLNAREQTTADALASVTVLAASAMVADALATAAFALGPQKGLNFLEHHGVSALLITPTLEEFVTSGFAGDTPIDCLRYDG